MGTIPLQERPNLHWVIESSESPVSQACPGPQARSMHKPSQAVLYQHCGVPIVKVLVKHMCWAFPGEMQDSSRRGGVMMRPPLRHYRVSRASNQKECGAAGLPAALGRTFRDWRLI